MSIGCGWVFVYFILIVQVFKQASVTWHVSGEVVWGVALGNTRFKKKNMGGQFFTRRLPSVRSVNADMPHSLLHGHRAAIPNFLFLFLCSFKFFTLRHLNMRNYRLAGKSTCLSGRIHGQYFTLKKKTKIIKKINSCRWKVELSKSIFANIQAVLRAIRCVKDVCPTVSACVSDL